VEGRLQTVEKKSEEKNKKNKEKFSKIKEKSSKIFVFLGLNVNISYICSFLTKQVSKIIN
jgi:hypothetical protein